MSDERKPSEDLKEGLGLLFRAARGAAKQVDVSKIDKGLDKAISQASRVATNVGRAVSDEVNRVSSQQSPPWKSGQKEADPANEPPAEDVGEGQVWASQAQQSGTEAPSGTEGGQEAKKPAGDEGQKVRVESEPE